MEDKYENIKEETRTLNVEILRNKTFNYVDLSGLCAWIVHDATFFILSMKTERNRHRAIHIQGHRIPSYYLLSSLPLSR